MVILDAYALIALLADEPVAEDVERILLSDATAMTAVNLAEAVDVLQRLHRFSRDEVEAAFEPLLAVVEVRPVSEAEAWRAGMLRARYYDRRSTSVSLADCFLLAAAGEHDAVVTSDPAVARIAHAEGIALVPLPDSAS